MKIDITLTDINFRFTDFECRPCRYGTFSGNHIVQCEDDEADFYGIYVKDLTGLHHHIIDVEGNKETALMVVFVIKSYCKFYAPHI